MRPDLPTPQLSHPLTLKLPDLLAPQLPDELTLNMPLLPMESNLNVAPLRDTLMLPDASLQTMNAGVVCNETERNYESSEEDVAQILLGTRFIREQESIADESAAIGV
jgi:hypothetical protein